MTLPPSGDPQRPLALAIRSTRLLGVVMILFSLLPIGGIIVTSRMFSSRPGAGVLAAVGVIGVLIMGPGVLYLLCAIFMKRRRKWAIIVAIILSSIQLAWIGFSGVMLIASIDGAPGSQKTGIAVAACVILVFVLAFVQLIVHLSKSFASIHHDPEAGTRGFSPIMVQPISAAHASSVPDQSGRTDS